MAATQALFFANGKNQRAVHTKRRDRSPPRGRQPGDADARPTEVVGPPLAAWMKHWGGAAGRRIDGGPSGFFPQGTGHSGERKIVGMQRTNHRGTEDTELLLREFVAWWQEFRIADFGLRIPQSTFRNPQWVAGVSPRYERTPRIEGNKRVHHSASSPWALCLCGSFETTQVPEGCGSRPAPENHENTKRRQHETKHEDDREGYASSRSGSYPPTLDFRFQRLSFFVLSLFRVFVIL
jgi:hypothetical protein